VGIKGLDPKLYRELKARSALNGITISEAMNQALKLWLKTAAGKSETEDARRRLREILEKGIGIGVPREYVMRTINEEAVLFE
jgi:hypothetical protein